MTTGWHDLDRLWGSMDLLRNRMTRMLREYDQPWLYLPTETEGNYPRINLYDEGEHFRIEAEVPGFTREQLKIKIEGNYLELSGAKPNQPPEGYTLHRAERQANSFSRSFTLPVEIDQDRAQASLKNGILSLELPKAETAKPRVIKIN